MKHILDNKLQQIFERWRSCACVGYRGLCTVFDTDDKNTT